MYIPDDDIDDLSRSAAEHYNAPGQPSWNALQQALDKELPQEKEKKRRGFFFFFLLLLGVSLAGAGVWYGVSTGKKQTVATVQSTNAKKQNGNTAAHTDSKDNKNGSDKTSIEKTNTPENLADKSVESSASKENNSNKKINNADKTTNTESSGQNKVAASVNTTSGNSSNTVDSKNPLAKNTTASAVTVHKAGTKNNPADNSFNSQQKAANGNKDNIVGNKPTQHYKSKSYPNNLTSSNGEDVNNSAVISGNISNKNKNKTGKGAKGKHNNNDLPAAVGASDNNDVAQNSSNTSGNDITVEPAANKPKETATPVAPTSQQDSSAAQNTKKPATTSVDTTAVAKKDSAEKKKNKSTREKALLFGLTAGVDYSTVKFTHGENAGYNIGLMAGYQFSKHWSAYTGVIYTKKNYKLDGKDYNPPQHYFTRYVDLHQN